MNCCNHNKMPRPVRGNAFNVAVTVVARRIDGTVIDDFALTSEAVLKITHGTSSVDKEYAIIDQNVAVIHFGGTDAAGIYGVEFTGEWNGEPWRFAVPVVFQIVELTTQGWLPQDGIIYEPTYEVDAEIVIAGGGGGGDVQADWTETDPDSPAYILHKPVDILEGTEIIACNITAVDNNHEATVDNTNWVYDAVAAYNAKKIPVLFGSVSSGVYYAMPLVVQSYEEDGISDYKMYGSAAVSINLGMGNYKQSILYAQSQTTHGGHSIYVTDFQDKLVSGENIKTINGNSLVGSGNIEVMVDTEVIECNVTSVDSSGVATVSNTNWFTQAVAAYNNHKLPIVNGTYNYAKFAVQLTVVEGSPYNNCYGSTAVTEYVGSGQVRVFAINFMATGNSPLVYVHDLQQKLTFDDTPTAGSSNPVKSSGVKDAVDAVRRSFYEAAGAVYNATTGYYELNGLTDITEAQMAEIYAIGRGFNFGKDNDYKFAYQLLRTNLLPITSGSQKCGVYTVYSANNAVSCRCMFGYTGTFEVVVVGIGKTGTEMGFYPLDAAAMFVNCSNLRTVLGVLKMKYCNTVSAMFTGCSSLRTIKLSEVKINNISFADSPLLYYSSLKYLVDKSSNTTAITVTVHADVYAKLTRTYEGSVMGKIQEEANETGQDATTLAQSWASLSSVAAGKNISFAEP